MEEQLDYLIFKVLTMLPPLKREILLKHVTAQTIPDVNSILYEDLDPESTGMINRIFHNVT